MLEGVEVDVFLCLAVAFRDCWCSQCSFESERASLGVLTIALDPIVAHKRVNERTVTRSCMAGMRGVVRFTQGQGDALRSTHVKEPNRACTGYSRRIGKHAWLCRLVTIME